jgi:uncharacterized membrane protein required for colicin V production
VTTIDWIALGFAALTGLAGLRRGLIGTALSLAGLVAGGVVGARVAPQLLASGSHSRYSSLIALGGAVAGASLLQGFASLAGGFLRGGLRLLPPLRLADSLGGLVAGAAWGLALVWLVAAVAVQLPGHAKLRREVRQSRVVEHLNRIAPPREVLRFRASFTRLRALSGF